MTPITCGKRLQTLISTSGDVSHIRFDKSNPYSLNLLISILLFEFVYAFCRINKFLLACEERMALRTYLNPHVLLRRPCMDNLTTGTGDSCLLILWMNSLFHFFQSPLAQR